MKSSTFWDVAQFSLVEVYQHLKQKQIQRPISGLKSMSSNQQEKLLCLLGLLFKPEDGGGSSEIQVNFYPTKWCHIPAIVLFK
jgi:hypothetical protein